MELFRYYSKGGELCIVHTKYHEDRFDKEWSLRINLEPYDYYKTEKGAKIAGTRLMHKLYKNGIKIIGLNA